METLRPYQVVGAQWLAGKSHALLGDVPRLGKTPQAITACDLIGAQRILVICPAIARVQWLNEFQKFSTRERKWDVVLSSSDPCGTVDGVICSYNLAIQNGVRTKLLAVNWDCVILDESHSLNNRQTSRSKLVWGQLAHKTKRIWALTGTPFRNHAAEIWPMLRVFGVYGGNYYHFIDEFLEVKNTPFGMKIEGVKPEKLADLKKMLRSIMLRRTLVEVLPQLPKIEFSDVSVEPSPVNPRKWFHDIILQRISEDELLRQIAEEIHATESYMQLMGASDSGVEGLAGLQGPRTDKSRRYVGLQKAPSVAKIVSEELQEGYYEKIVLFAWHRDVVECLRQELRDWHPETLYGGMTVKNQEAAKRAFNKNPKVRVLICNIVAAGVAIDLSVTNEVGFVEPSYVPSDNAQAAMRVYCFGQSKPVRVRFFNLHNSIDTQINRILRSKTRNLVSLLDDGKPAQAEEIYNPFAE